MKTLQPHLFLALLTLGCALEAGRPLSPAERAVVRETQRRFELHEPPVDAPRDPRVTYDPSCLDDLSITTHVPSTEPACGVEAYACLIRRHIVVREGTNIPRAIVHESLHQLCACAGYTLDPLHAWCPGVWGQSGIEVDAKDASEALYQEAVGCPGQLYSNNPRCEDGT